MKNVLLLFSILLMAGSCGSMKDTPEDIAKKYLTALKNKDWETALKYATPSTRDQIEMMKSLGTEFGITEIKDIKCEVRDSRAMCTFCCAKDSNFNRILLTLNDKNQWLANQSKGSWLDYHYWDSIK
jgi:hypothetical protein